MKASHFSKDTLEFIRLLAKHGVKYVIVGGEAVIYHGYARLTGDVDFFYGCSQDNLKKLFKMLQEFWGGTIPGVKSIKELSVKKQVIQFGAPPNRLDLFNSIDGVGFEKVWKSKISENIATGKEKIPLYFIALNELILNKKSSARYKDKEDLKYLEGKPIKINPKQKAKKS